MGVGTRRNGSRPQPVADNGNCHETPGATVSVRDMTASATSQHRASAARAGDTDAARADSGRGKAPGGKGTDAARSRKRRQLREDQAIAYLLGGMTITETAHKLKVSRSTVHRWLNDPFLQSKIESLRDDIVDAMFDQQLQASRLATPRLVELMDSDDHRVAVRAAIALQAAGQRVYHFMDLKKRIERVEDNLMITERIKR